MRVSGRDVSRQAGKRLAGGVLTRRGSREDCASQGEMEDGKVHSGRLDVEDIEKQLNGLKL
jgi:hypothetical protein